MFPEAGESDSATGTVNFDADFANASVTGIMSLKDAVGDTAGPIDLRDIDLTFGQSFFSLSGSNSFDPSRNDGTITGNTFETDLKADHAEWAKAGFQSAPDIILTGGFFGPNGEAATGVGIGNGWASNGPNGTQIILLSTINAAKD